MTKELFDIFCALYGATFRPCWWNIRQSAVTTMLLPTSLPVPSSARHFAGVFLLLDIDGYSLRLMILGDILVYVLVCYGYLLGTARVLLGRAFRAVRGGIRSR